MNHSSPGLGKLLAFKALCCGGPLIVLAIASGAIALVDVAVAALVVSVLLGAYVVYRHKRACASELPKPPASRQNGPVARADRDESLRQEARRVPA